MLKSSYLVFASAIFLTGCISANPVITEPAIEKIADNAELYNQRTIDIAANELLLNILRARDHSPRAYSSISDVSMTPGGDFKSSIEAGGLGRGAAWTGIGGSVSSSSNDKLSYTLANAAKSDGKNFADQRFDATTFNEFWSQPWPRAMLLHIFFQENAFEIIQDGNAADELMDYYKLGSGPFNAEDKKVTYPGAGQEPFYVMSDNGKLSYCLNALQVCIEKKPTKEAKKKGLSAQRSLDTVTIDVGMTLEAKPKAKPKKDEYKWRDSKVYQEPDSVWANRPSDDFLPGSNLVNQVLYAESSEEKFSQLNKFKLIYCSAHPKIELLTTKDYAGNVIADNVFRPVNLFTCSDALSDVVAKNAQPYFLVLDSTGKPRIYQPKFSTFDNAIYLLGRSLRPQKNSKNELIVGTPKSIYTTEQRYCSPFHPTDANCAKNKSLLDIHVTDKLTPSLFDKCAGSYVAQVNYRGAMYRAGLPEPDDNYSSCEERDAMTSTTLILLSKIVDYSIQRPEISTQLLITQ